MQRWARPWFLTWGMFFSVFLIRGALPWLIIWATIPGLGPLGALLSTLSGDPAVSSAIKSPPPRSS
ncbi:MAG: hypothetical protein RQ758_05595 [Methanomicrobiaceae archaeon]|nr:hypothetical protein [Methanomicrobiaceae archaeon]